MTLSFEDALVEVIVGRSAFDGDKHNMALYAIQQYRIMKTHLAESKYGQLSDLIIAFCNDKIDSFAFERKVKELLSS